MVQVGPSQFLTWVKSASQTRSAIACAIGNSSVSGVRQRLTQRQCRLCSWASSTARVCGWVSDVTIAP